MNALRKNTAGAVRERTEKKNVRNSPADTELDEDGKGAPSAGGILLPAAMVKTTVRKDVTQQPMEITVEQVDMPRRKSQPLEILHRSRFTSRS